jgi:hypothetical protein
VGQRYHWDPENRREENAIIAKGLLKHGQFLKNGMDNEVSPQYFILDYLIVPAGPFKQPCPPCTLWSYN